MGVVFEKANNASLIIAEEIDYLSKIDVVDIFEDTEERLKSSLIELGKLLHQIRLERANE